MTEVADFNPLNAIAAVFCSASSSEPAKFLGTCFAFRQTTHFLTAGHCIGTLQESELFIVHPQIGLTVRVQEIVRHATADIALLKTEPIESNDAEAFYALASCRYIGTDCYAFGFPERIFGDAADSRQPTARLFKCYFQRFMQHESYLGYCYEAAELNVACPTGLSGGPVYRADWTKFLCGLVTENLESTTYLASIEETQKDGAVLQKHYRNIINYGVCLMLADVRAWLNEHIPQTTTDHL